ncbi:MAG TPA: DUF72 domain-containing protein [Methylocella sp.]|nr:DUF72 domain-containing protein [Methylocella sp.]
MVNNFYVGIGGWNFPPWRGTFYPKGLARNRELAYASEHLTSIEINGTYYRTQSPGSFAKWHDETPAGFIFAIKGPRFATQRRLLAEAGPSIERFLASGIIDLKEKLGPINWQFLPNRHFDAADFEAFLKLLPDSFKGHSLRHAVEVRHGTFQTREVIDLVRAYKIGIVFTDSEPFPNIFDASAPFVYLRLQRASEQEANGYPEAALDDWAKRAVAWSQGKSPDGLDLLAGEEKKPPKRRDVFIYFIDGFKPKAPAGAMALVRKLEKK